MKIFIVTKNHEWFKAFLSNQPKEMLSFYHYLYDTRLIRGQRPLIVIYAEKWHENRPEFLDEIEAIIASQKRLNETYFNMTKK